MWFLYILSWIALLIQICFVTLSIAAGLYYLAELVEEFTVMSGKIIKYMVIITTVVYLGLMVFENLPYTMTIPGLLSNVIHFLLLKDFPYIELTSPVFIASVGLLVINHYFAFSYFSSVWHPFSEVLAYFTLCLWLVPFAFFVSLSANENVLPTLATPAASQDETDGDIVSNYFRKKGKRWGLLSMLKTAQETVLPQRVKKGY